MNRTQLSGHVSREPRHYLSERISGRNPHPGICIRQRVLESRNGVGRLADFVLDRLAASWPGSEYCEKLSGELSFSKKGELTYRYNQAITGGKTTTKSAVETFYLNSKRTKYEKRRSQVN